MDIKTVLNYINTAAAEELGQIKTKIKLREMMDKMQVKPSNWKLTLEKLVDGEATCGYYWKTAAGDSLTVIHHRDSLAICYQERILHYLGGYKCFGDLRLDEIYKVCMGLDIAEACEVWPRSCGAEFTLVNEYRGMLRLLGCPEHFVSGILQGVKLLENSAAES